MADLVVIVPSRGRPEAARALVQHFAMTCTADTYLNFAVDLSDLRAYDYPVGWAELPNVGISFSPGSNMVQALNYAAEGLAGQDHFAIGFLGDDHCPRTYGWDQAYLDALHEMGTGIVYGNDLLRGKDLPTQCAMTSDIVRALGYMAPPTLVHLYVDNFWLDLGRAADCIRYLPDVIVEHRHPVAGKAAWDEGYRRVNAPAVYAADEKAYNEYLATRFADDVAKVVALRGVASVR